MSADSAPFMPKCVVVDPNFDWHGQAALAQPALGQYDYL